MLRRLRSSFAGRLLAAGTLFSLVLIAGVGGYLIYSRAAQVNAAALSNADNRAGTMNQTLVRVTASQALSASLGLAQQASLQSALHDPVPVTAVGELFGSSASVDLSGEVLVITDGNRNPIFSHAAAGVSPLSVDDMRGAAVDEALREGTCPIGFSGFSSTPGGCGVELLRGGEAVYAVAVPVRFNGAVVGTVGYVAPLSYQLRNFDAIFQFPTAFIAAANPDVEVHDNGTTTPTSPQLRTLLQGKPQAAHATYSSAGGDLAGSFAEVQDPRGELIGWIGIEAPVSQFVGDTGNDIRALAFISIFVLAVVWIAVVVFVDRFVARPIDRLERGVQRIADGDYASDIEVVSHDEIGRLAGNVNRMRVAIASYIEEIREARRRLDSAVERMSGLSRALTATTAGVPALQQEVVRSAAAIAGEGAVATLMMRDGETLNPVAVHGGEPVDLRAFGGWKGLLAGEVVHSEGDARGALLAVPMHYQEKVVGALAISAGEEVISRVSNEADVLVVLANNAAIAMENARLFEQERETVQRLRQLDAMKTDFLSTVQHELRTPLTAILGLSDLIEMCWEMWEEEPKLEAIRDIQVAAKNLYDIVETIIDFSAMDEDKLGLNPAQVGVAETLEKAVETVGERYKGGLPVPVTITGENGLAVFADPDRFSQTLRALIDNAVKFSDGQGEVLVDYQAANRGREVRIRIRDQGVGIPADDLPRIFDRFYQVDNTATRRYGGTGMGLALVKRLVQAHGARIEVESSVGVGTVAIVDWPAHASSASGEARAVAEARGETSPEKPKPGRRRAAVPVQ